ncbi:MAG: endonuclease/exonuclease/phosphatase family protein [Calditrichaeota bacterium]|nr:MAG: endonuclease/exonuclease/phosphatase [Calditrichota bacterium]MBL1205193.1 endonuclease/exonuclease/phosphatase family protein [Calditrichota bacterium]NOG45023.1 endonuclease/exonuclease/phosphatase family protein [Calditrichota bacterium]
MIIKRLYIFLIFLVFLAGCQPGVDRPVKVMTFNIRYGLVDDGQNSWQYRKTFVADVIKYHQPGIVGLQEALGFQLAYLDSSLDHYTWFGAARDDGKQQGEYTAILYDSRRFKMLRNSTFWLSETPDKPSQSWDAALKRTVTWAEFEDSKTSKRFFYFNTHFDHRGDTARYESAKLLKRKITEIAKNNYIILTGDFNCDPLDEPYKHLTSKDIPDSEILFDTRLISKSGHYGPNSTFTGFDLNADPSEPIDFIFCGDKITIKKHATISDTFDGKLPSDHYPILVELTLNYN